MAPTLLNEKHVYVSWTLLTMLLMAAIGAAIYMAKISFQLEQLAPLVSFVSQIDKRVSILEYKNDVQDFASDK